MANEDFFRDSLLSMQSYCWCKVGPLLVINGIITPISRVITPVTHLFSAIYRAENNSTYNDRRGPPCGIVWTKF